VNFASFHCRQHSTKRFYQSMFYLNWNDWLVFIYVRCFSCLHVFYRFCYVSWCFLSCLIFWRSCSSPRMSYCVKRLLDFTWLESYFVWRMIETTLKHHSALTWKQYCRVVNDVLYCCADRRLAVRILKHLRAPGAYWNWFITSANMFVFLFRFVSICSALRRARLVLADG